MKKYNVIGLMSGTSLDGLDVALCNFFQTREKWKYKIIAAKTYSYSKEWKEKLSTVEKRTAEELAKLHSEYGHFIGKIVKNFNKKYSLPFGEGKGGAVDFVASHGHTIFHQPEKKFTLQIGNGAAIAAECDLPVVCDFRATDVALGGQGAPLVPIGDKFLFSDFDFCLNIGGITNISYEENISRKGEKAQRIAFDICPANIVLNHLAKKLGKEFDRNGEIARQGKVNKKLLYKLNSLKYYSLKPPKSLGKEWIVKEFFAVLEKYKISIQDKMRTVVEHIAAQINLHLKTVSELRTHNYKLLITGGGAHNKFLIQRINYQLPTTNYQLPTTN